MKKQFAYLHNHTKFSIQDAMPSPKDYVDKIYEINQTSNDYECIALALTDHGNISVLPQQYNACLKPDDPNRKIKPLFGFEAYHCVDVNNNPNGDRFHMVLLAKNQKGLENIYQIASHGGMNIVKGRTKNFPVTDLDFIKNHGEGVICLTACIAGIIPQMILNGKETDAIDLISKLKIYVDELYLEVQPLDIPEQLLVNEAMVRLSQSTNTKLVMTCDAHYIEKSDIQYHNLFKEISHQKPFTTENYLRTPEEMEQYCLQYNIPLEAITNSAEIANMCDVDPKPKDHRALLPIYPCPVGYDESSYLRELCIQFLNDKIIEKKIAEPEKYIKEMLYELDVICNAGFAGYFLILWDWFKWCRDNDILTGPGRGSAAGSIVSYVLNITKVDPIKNGFYFERFLSPERLEFPDVDTDIPRDKRADAINYLLGKYGKENVSQIVTFGEYKVKNTIKAVLSKYNCPIAEANKITKSLPDMVDGKAVTFDLLEHRHNNPDDYDSWEETDLKTLDKAWETLEEVFQQYPQVYDALKHISGCYNNTGIHAGGVIICNKPINQNGQVMMGSETAVLPILQFEMGDLDFFGFLKIDVLGLKTLDTIKYTMDLAHLNYDWYDSEDYTDPEVYRMLREGETTDVFQMARYAPTKMISDFNVTNIEGLCAVNAGNRPGPLEKDKNTGKSMVDLFIDHVKTNTPEDWGNADVNEILKNTYGCLWYQENCIMLGRVMAGYSMGGADSRIRKVLGKKKVKMIPEIKNEFIYGKKSLFDEDHNVIGISEEPSDYCEGAVNRGYDLQLCEKIFDTMAAFAKYSFNKSHSFCYGVIAYKTAWLSYHYPIEFAIANCTINEKEEDIISTLASARKRKIRVLPPDINKSQVDFSNDNGAIRYGIKAIKGVGSRVIDFLRDYKLMDNVPFQNLDDFYSRVHDTNNPIVSSLINSIQQQTGKASPNPLKKDVEIALILSGCFDFQEKNRFTLVNYYISNIRKENPSTIKIMGEDKKFPLDDKKYDSKQKLALEMFYMGAYISEHPLDKFPYIDLDAAQEGEKVRIGGIVTGVTKKQTKTGKDYLVIKFKGKDDIERNTNMFFEDRVKSLEQDLKKNQIIVVTGTYSQRYHNINASDIKIQIDKKQMLQQENLQINTVQNQQVPVGMPVVQAPDMFKGLFD